MNLLLLSLLVAGALSQPVTYSDEEETQWELFKIEHEKYYSDEKEENLRKEIFMKNLNFIHEHNKRYVNGEVTFTVGVNEFSDLTKEEFRQRMNGFKVPDNYEAIGTQFELVEGLELPKSVDWRKEGAVTPVKNQLLCGSCWAFSATGSLEGQAFLKTKKLIPLSEQNLVDCSTKQGNFGCRGGYVKGAFNYVKENNGIDTESSYPYMAKDGVCHYKAEGKGATCTGYIAIPRGSEKALQQAVAKAGPVSVAIDGSGLWHYKGGVFKDSNCSSTSLDHAVLVVGYGTNNKGEDYWLVKNSWGKSFGMGGYILMARNHNNMCGIASDASYPIV